MRSSAPVGVDNPGLMYLDFVDALELCDAVTQCQKCASIVSTAMTNSSRTSLDLLSTWVIARVPDNAARWFDEQRKRLASKPTDKDVYLALGYATRKLGKSDLDLKPRDLADAEAVRSGWDPSDWSIDQAARIAFVLASYDGDAERFRARLEQLFNTADIGELIAFYRGLPLYPDAKLHVARAREGTRSAMQPVFEAVAHRNPFAKEQFDENAWNHMVLKALFVGSRLAPIQGLDERANPRLMRMLCDYAHERWAAGRAISPELWRCVGPHADAAAVQDLSRVLKSGDAAERQAAALALSDAPGNGAAQALQSAPELLAAARAGALKWADIARG